MAVSHGKGEASQLLRPAVNGSTSSQGVNCYSDSDGPQHRGNCDRSRRCLRVWVSSPGLDRGNGSTRATPQIRSSEREPGEAASSRLKLSLSARSTSGLGLSASGHISAANWRRPGARPGIQLLPPAVGPTRASSRGPGSMFSRPAEHDRVLARPVSTRCRRASGGRGRGVKPRPLPSSTAALWPRDYGNSRPSPGAPASTAPLTPVREAPLSASQSSGPAGQWLSGACRGGCARRPPAGQHRGDGFGSP